MKDVLLDKDGDLEFVNGDLNIGYSDNQNQQLILISNKGEFREFPELGVGIDKLISDDDYMATLIEIKKNLEYDGMKINNIKIDETGNLDIDGHYK